MVLFNCRKRTGCFRVGSGRSRSRQSGLVLVVQAHPVHGASALVTALGDEIEPVERTHQQLGAAMIGRVGMEDGAAVIQYPLKDADNGNQVWNLEKTK